MTSEIINYANSIVEKTKINFTLLSSDSSVVFGKKSKYQIPNYINGVLEDKNSDRTFFAIKILNENYTGIIQGVSLENKNYAILISSLFENYFNKNYSLGKEDFYRALLFGELDEIKIKKYLRIYKTVDKKSCVILVQSVNNSKDIVEIANYYSEKDIAFAVSIDNNNCVIVKINEKGSGEYNSAVEFTEFLTESIYEEKGISTDCFIGSTVENLSLISVSYNEAIETKKMSKSLNYPKGIHSFKEFMLLHILKELPEYKINEFHNLLTDYSEKDIFNDKEMLLTAEEFLKNSLNISETARKLYLHRNTLTYRLDKIERESGLDLRKFSDAVTFRLVMLLKSLLR